MAAAMDSTGKPRARLNFGKIEGGSHRRGFPTDRTLIRSATETYCDCIVVLARRVRGIAERTLRLCAPEHVGPGRFSGRAELNGT